MKQFSRFCRIVLLVSIIIGFCGLPGLAMQVTGDNVAFGFFDASGGRLIVTGSAIALDVNKEIYALFSGNQFQSIQFLQQQSRAVGDSGRQTATNFDRLPGYVFSINSPGSPNKSCLVVEKSFLTERRLLPCQSRIEGCDANETGLIESARGLRIEQSSGIAQLDNGGRLLLVRFELVGDQAVAALVYIAADNRLVFREFSAKYNPVSTWRVDDGGDIRPEQFRILVMAQKDNCLEMAYEFLGPEGIIIEMVREQGGQFQTIAKASRNTSPL